MVPIGGTLQLTETAGSDTSFPFTRDCPAGSVATGMIAAPGPGPENIGLFQMRCRTVSVVASVATGALTGALSTAVTTTAVAGSGSEPVALDCPADMVVSGMTGRVASLFRRFQLTCRQPFGGTETGLSPVLQTFPSGASFTVSCPVGTAATGFEGTVANNRAVSLRLHCQ
jgi:hypothetical protein